MADRWRNAYRYGPICGLALGLLLFTVAAREGPLTRAVVVGIAGTCLAIAAVTADLGPGARRRASGATVALIATLSVLALLDVLTPTATSIVAGIFVAATAVAITGGLVKLVGETGVTVQAVAGGLAIFALSGLMFAFAIDAGARAADGGYYAGGRDGTLSENVYYSITVLTSTGFGDFTPATRGGRMLASAEMLFGQIYLVTVVALLVSNLRGRGR